MALLEHQHNNQKIQIEIKLPDYGYYSKPEATTDNQHSGAMRYDAKKENVIYMIATNPEQYQHIEFYAHTEEMAGAVTLEQMGEYGEICKVTVNDPITFVIIHCKRQFKNGQWDHSGNGFTIVEEPARAALRSLKTSSKHQITVKWEGQEKADGRYYGSWSSYKSIVCK